MSETTNPTQQSPPHCHGVAMAKQLQLRPHFTPNQGTAHTYMKTNTTDKKPLRVTVSELSPRRCPRRAADAVARPSKWRVTPRKCCEACTPSPCATCYVVDSAYCRRWFPAPAWIRANPTSQPKGHPIQLWRHRIWPSPAP